MRRDTSPLTNPRASAARIASTLFSPRAAATTSALSRAGRGADAKVTGAYATHGRQHLDYATTQEHAAPNTTSDIAFRGKYGWRL